MQRNVFLLGATGSIGSTTLQAIRDQPREFRLIGVSANRSVDKLQTIVEEFAPETIHMQDRQSAKALSQRLGRSVLGGDELLQRLAMHTEETVMAGMVGYAGLLPVLESLKAGKTVLLANKETLVAGGHLVKEALRSNPGAQLYPVDSEHAAIHQCLRGENPSEIEKLTLTASGGSFLKRSLAEMQDIRPEQAIRHPNWDMGAKITVDSSTMMNKGLEVIEAHWLFDIDYDSIEVVIHPQSIIHSLVEFQDGGMMAQLSTPDMRLPVRYALNHAQKRSADSGLQRLRLSELGQLDFQAPDFQKFLNLALAYEAGRQGGTAPCALNAANEVAVQAFLNSQIGFLEIARINQIVLEQHRNHANPTLEEILKADAEARWCADAAIQKGPSSCA